MRSGFVIILATVIGCATAPTTVEQPQRVEQPQQADQRAGQGITTASSAAGNSQSGVGEQPNRMGLQASQSDGATITTPALDRDGQVILGADGKPLMTTVAGRGLRDVYVGSTIENNSESTISGTAEGVSQGQTGSPTVTSSPSTTQTPTATNQPSIPVDINVTPGSGGTP